MNNFNDPLRKSLGETIPDLCMCDHCAEQYVARKCSPIELMLLNMIALLDRRDPYWSQMHVQWPIDQCRADIAMWSKDHGVPFVVECDGHDFHERTKEQAAHDRSRDRFMQTHGIRVVRFTGSEIWRDPIQCAYQLQQLVIGADVERDLLSK